MRTAFGPPPFIAATAASASTSTNFLQNALKLPHYDRLAVPGGAACLAGHLFAYREEWGLVEHLRFLVRAHGLERLILIAHQDCAFYAEQPCVTSLPLEARQREDLRTAATRIGSFAPNLSVDAFFARKRVDGTIRFESMAKWQLNESRDSARPGR